MGLPGIDDQDEGPEYPNPNQFGLRNIFGNQNIGWSASEGASPLSFNFASPKVPGFNFGIPWAPMQPYGNNPMPVSLNIYGGSTGTDSGTSGTNGTNGSGANISVSYYTDAVNPVTVNPCNSIYFNFRDGDVSDDGAGNVTVSYSVSGGGGTIHTTAPLDGGAPISTNPTLSLLYDSSSSFQLSGGNTLQLKSVTVTPPSSTGYVSDITVDGFGRVTAFSRNDLAAYRITAATYQGSGYWKYTLRKQSTTLGSTFPFFQDASPAVNVDGYNYLETANSGAGAGGLAYGMNSNNSTSPIVLTDYLNYTMRPVPTGLVVNVWKWDTKYFFTAPNPIGGSCPS
jgi:hypothetical protein